MKSIPRWGRSSRRVLNSRTLAMLLGLWFVCSPQAHAAGLEDWEAKLLGDLCAKYLRKEPEPAESGSSPHEMLERVSKAMGSRLAEQGLSGVPAEDLGALALLRARLGPGIEPASHTQTRSTLASHAPTGAIPEPVVSEARPPDAQQVDVRRGEEGIRVAQERLARLPLSQRMVMTGDIGTVLQAATVPNNSDLTTTVGRARLNFVFRAFPGGKARRLGDGYLFMQMTAAGGALDTSVVGGPASFSPLNHIATDRSRFNDSTYQGNLYLSRVYYEQQLNLGDDYIKGRVGILQLSDYFDANSFANNESRQFLNSALVNSPGFKGAINAPGIMFEYRRHMRRDWLQAAVVRAGYGVSRIDRAFTSPVWNAEVELETKLSGKSGHWRFGGTVGNRAGAGGLHGFYYNFDQFVTSRVGVFGRYAISNGGPGSFAFGPVRQSYGGGVQVRFVDREERVSAWSLGFSQAFGIPTDQPLASEKVLETYYRWQWTENISISPDLQLVFGSGGRQVDGTQVVLGTRFNFVF